MNSFAIYFAAKDAVDIVATYGCEVIGLDRIYKTVCEKLPLYTITVADDLGHTWPVALAILSEDIANAIKHFLEAFHCKIECELGQTCHLTVMMDKSATQKKALKMLN